jgi:hypothetical protein
MGKLLAMPKPSRLFRIVIKAHPAYASVSITVVMLNRTANASVTKSFDCMSEAVRQLSELGIHVSLIQEAITALSEGRNCIMEDCWLADDAFRSFKTGKL